MSADQNMEDDTAVVGLAEDAADVGKDANDEIVADSDEDSGGSDEDVPDAPEDDYESDGEGQEWSLGFCVEAPADEGGLLEHLVHGAVELGSESSVQPLQVDHVDGARRRLRTGRVHRQEAKIARTLAA